MKALVRGWGGFIGSHLVDRLLEKGWEVTVFDRSEFKDYSDLHQIRNHNNLQFYKVNLDKFDQIEKIKKNFEYIFHFAAELGVENVLKAAYQVLNSNISSTKNIINYAKLNSELRRFVFASTSEVYDGTLKCFNTEIPTSESEPLTVASVSSPRTTYMLSKTIGESFCHFSGLPFTILRIFNTYGSRAGKKHVIPELLERIYKAKSGESIDVYSPNHSRSFCHIADAINQIIGITDNENCKGETINLGNQTREIKMQDLAEICIQVSGKDLQINKLKDTEGSPRRRTPCMKKSIQLTGCQPKVTLEKGVAKTYSWYIENVFNI